jgi:hypothetical protein
MKREVIVEYGACGEQLVIDPDESMFHVVTCPACGATCEFDEACDAVRVIVERKGAP